MTALLTCMFVQVAVLVHGSSMDISSVLNETHSVLDSFYPGMYGAKAIAETIFGLSVPGGKLPWTYYHTNFTERISMDEFSCAVGPGRGYRYLDPEDRDIILPFGHGLSYTSFSLTLVSPATFHFDTTSAHVSSLNISFAVTNTGSTFAGTETVMAFIRPGNRTNPGGSKLLPLQRRLCGYGKIGPIPVGASATGVIELEASDLAMADATGSLAWLPGDYSIILSRGCIGEPEITVPLRISGGRRVVWTLPEI